jgi:hypothetical protein
MHKPNYIKVAFWNVGNLFDIEKNEIATDFEFTPERGWTKDVRDRKLDNLAKVIKSMNFTDNTNEPDFEPDLLGLCEVENKIVLEELIKRINPEKYSIAEYHDSPDLRGIDTCLVYSKEMFECLNTSAYDIDFRYPTRDIFQAHLKVKENDSELHILVNHWPSRRGKYDSCQPNDTAHARNTVAEKCGKIVDTLLKVSKEQVYLLPNIFNKNDLIKLDYEWNKNILLMGDFNDDPYDESISKYLNTVSDIRACKEWKEILEIRSKDEKSPLDVSHRKYYLEQSTYLFNCMWKLVGDPNAIGNTNLDPNVPRGSIHYWGTDRWSIFDQFIVSQGLHHGKQKLKFRNDSAKIVYDGLRLVDNLSYDKFDNSNNENYNYYYLVDKAKIHPSLKDNPMDFVYLRRFYNEKTKQFEDDNRSIPAGRDKDTGYSDHFPVLCIIDIL